VCVRVHRAEKFLAIFESERCKMIEMSCEQHDRYAASSQFITHLTGRILGQQGLESTPIDTRGGLA
jgi:prephenate dehydrogenase